MKPNNVIDAKVEGNLGGETVKMEIDANATAHLMSVLTDLYSDRIMAFIREYATNAWDAHIEAGIARAIEVTLPNRMESYYRVRDYGKGLSLDDVRNVYSKYGTSTKRESNDFNGMLGLGCKSAMTYAAQFSIISIHDGVKHNVAVSRGLDGVGEMQIIDSTPTSEPSGVEIVIPVKKDDHWDVKAKVTEFFQWWPENTVKVNGLAPTRFEGREVVKNVFMVDGMEKDVIVMGNVAYPLPEGYIIWEAEQDRWGYNRKDFAVAYFAEIGEVTIAPNRESLSTTKATVTTINRVKGEFQAHLISSIQKEIDGSATRRDAIIAYQTMLSRYRTLDLSKMTYKGDEFPNKIEAPFKMVTPEQTGYQKLQNIQPAPVKDYESFFRYDANGGSSETTRDHMELQDVRNLLNGGVFVVNAPKSFSTHQRTKIRRAYEADLFGNWNVWLIQQSTVPGLPWTADVEVVDWSVIRDFKDSSASVSDRTKHNVVEKDGTSNYRTIPDDEKIVYASPTDFKDGWGYRRTAADARAQANKQGYSFVLMGKNRHTKFKREHVNAMTDSEMTKRLVTEYENSLTDDDKWFLGMSDESHERLIALRKVDVADPDVVALTNKADSARRKDLFDKRRVMVQRVHGTTARLNEVKTVEPLADYKILTHIPARDYKNCAADISAYIKAVYDSKKGN